MSKVFLDLQFSTLYTSPPTFPLPYTPEGLPLIPELWHLPLQNNQGHRMLWFVHQNEKQNKNNPFKHHFRSFPQTFTSESLPGLQQQQCTVMTFTDICTPLSVPGQLGGRGRNGQTAAGTVTHTNQFQFLNIGLYKEYPQTQHKIETKHNLVLLHSKYNNTKL